MRLENLKLPFLSMDLEDRLKLIGGIQQDRLVDKRGIKRGHELVKEFSMLSEEEKMLALQSLEKS